MDRTKLGDKAKAPAQRIEAYASSRDGLADIFDFRPGNLKAACEAIVDIAGNPEPPLRLYVGHGLDSVRECCAENLDTWWTLQSLTARTL